ncbi:porin [Thalassotalea sp. HSM 43]|uniref:porin n=1 Tax=Thalassotalea sp. HSM 43 TaxID=2552945 RepID=UPI001081E93D|nr:porin [Thalassotalea sp. HSM 43]QBY05018.1 porin [Thalassotalea sp. HSM 43]
MKTKLSLAVAAIACALSSTTQAIEIYKDDKTSVATRGYLRLTFESNNNSDELTDGGSRWGLDFTRKIQGGWTAGVTTEWAMNFESNKDFSVSFRGNDSNVATGDAGDTLSSRLGYIHMTHDTWGSFGFGKQWSVYYDVTGVTDLLDYYGGSALGVYNLGGDGGLSGTGRAEQAITWRKSFGNLNVGLQYQAQDEDITLDLPDCAGITDTQAAFDLCESLNGVSLGTIGDGYGASLSYRFGKFWAGVAHNVTEIEGNSTADAIGLGNAEDDTISAVAATYGTLLDGLYIAVGAATSEFHELDDTGNYLDTMGYEAMIRYNFNSGFGFYGGMNYLESDEDDNDFEISYPFLGADYVFIDDIGFVFAEVRMNDNVNADGSDGNDNTDVAVGIRVNL